MVKKKHSLSMKSSHGKEFNSDYCLNFALKPKNDETSIQKKNSTEVNAPTLNSHLLVNDDSNIDSVLSFPIVAIGMSADAIGLEALSQLFRNTSSDTGVAFVLIIHLIPTETTPVLTLLQQHTEMPLLLIEDDMPVKPNHVYINPPAQELAIINGTLHLMPIPKSCNPIHPIDYFFRSLAQDQNRNAVGIILSGTGSDGTLGVKAIKESLGMIMVQDEVSAKYSGMVRSAISTGLADYVLPPDQIPVQLVRHIRCTHRKQKFLNTFFENPLSVYLNHICDILLTRTNHDFKYYKKNTICRRVERRMNVHQLSDIKDYVHYLEQSTHEANILFKELLIGVTNFFRDSPAFELLQTDIFPTLLSEKKNDEPFRIWVPGCATGEEAYSVAIVLHECMERTGRHFHVQIFGTDIDSEAIATARNGLYPDNILSDIGPNRIKRYFSKEDDGRYRIKKTIREMLIFAEQNVIKDPPFTRLDLLCCRNLLIYLGMELQIKLLPIFHYSLKPDGVLFLGSSESIGQASNLFFPIHKKWKFFRRISSVSSSRPTLELSSSLSLNHRLETESDLFPKNFHNLNLLNLSLIDIILKQSNTPPCVIVNENCEIIYIHGRTGRFLELAEGKTSVNILEMARPGLRNILATSIRHISVYKQRMIKKITEIDINGNRLYLNLVIKQIPDMNPGLRGLIMIIFEECDTILNGNTISPQTIQSKRGSLIFDDVKEELQYTKETLQNTIEELEAANEELTSANEELQSTNEELQYTNEELETSKEELHSLNEESSIINSELQSRIDELSKFNENMKNLLNSIDVATVFLDTALTVRWFTPKSQEIIPLTANDIDRPLKHFASSLNVDITLYSKQVLSDLVVREVVAFSKDGRHFVMRVRPYRTRADIVDGVVITFDDISGTVRDKETLYQRTERLEQIERNLDFLLSNGFQHALCMNREGTILEYKGAKWMTFDQNSSVGKNLLDLLPEHLVQLELGRNQEIFDTGNFSREETTYNWNGTSHRFSEYRYPIRSEDGSVEAVGLVRQNAMNTNDLQEALIKANSLYNILLGKVPDGIFELSNSFEIVYANARYAKMLDTEVSSLIGRSWFDVLHGDGQIEARILQERCMTGETVEGEVSIGMGTKRFHHLEPLFSNENFQGILAFVK